MVMCKYEDRIGNYVNFFLFQEMKLFLLRE